MYDIPFVSMKLICDDTRVMISAERGVTIDMSILNAACLLGTDNEPNPVDDMEPECPETRDMIREYPKNLPDTQIVCREYRAKKKEDAVEVYTSYMGGWSGESIIIRLTEKLYFEVFRYFDRDAENHAAQIIFTPQSLKFIEKTI